MSNSLQPPPDIAIAEDPSLTSATHQDVMGNIMDPYNAGATDVECTASAVARGASSVVDAAIDEQHPSPISAVADSPPAGVDINSGSTTVESTVSALAPRGALPTAIANTDTTDERDSLIIKFRSQIKLAVDELEVGLDDKIRLLESKQHEPKIERTQEKLRNGPEDLKKHEALITVLQTKLNDATAQLAPTQQQLAAATAELVTTAAQLAAATAQLTMSEEHLAAARAQELHRDGFIEALQNNILDVQAQLLEARINFRCPIIVCQRRTQYTWPTVIIFKITVASACEGRRPDGFWQIDQIVGETNNNGNTLVTRSEILAEVNNNPTAKYIIGEGPTPTKIKTPSIEQSLQGLAAFIESSYLLPYYLVKTNMSTLPKDSAAAKFPVLQDRTGFLVPKYDVDTEVLEFTPQAVFNLVYAIMQPGSAASAISSESNKILFETPPPVGWIPTMSPCPTRQTCLVPSGVETDKGIIQLETKTSSSTTLHLEIGAGILLLMCIIALIVSFSAK
ncbi:hypothetical protein BDK51DRAFT_28653 [Blyttiomyces helicus]|uniref:Uncharacterized protein n=1 Tax=Blyttiomyces helicus TaxID=388810 RepID=A0A4P9WAN4_9FUNG|nr:hypothetical protein BDK51DRAFT_28653 [Blyttiomyces helicus]|eukprot:RKO87930.1 hypothetical protein BDK51DRAFT_28653 [Blyttiomyces helicus]